MIFLLLAILTALPATETGTLPQGTDHCYEAATAAEAGPYLQSTARVPGEEAYYSIIPRSYLCRKAAVPPEIDGRYDVDIWDTAEWTEDFIDIEGAGKPLPRFRTRVKMLWDDSCLYVYAEMEEPHVWGTLTKRDAVIFHDNDFEIFLDPTGDNHNYYELEINALGTVWDLFLDKPYRDRGKADNSWDINELRTAVHVRGSLNDPAGSDEGWSVEMALPWKSFDRDLISDDAAKNAEGKKPWYASVNRQDPVPTTDEQWRINFSRVQWRHEVRDGQYQKIEDTKADNWVWSPQGVVDMHRPEKWGYIQFADGVNGAEFKPDTLYRAKMKLLRLYYAQKAYYKKHKEYARDLPSLQLDPWAFKYHGARPEINIKGNKYGISYTISTYYDNPNSHMSGSEKWLGIFEDSRLQRVGFELGKPISP